MNETANTKRKLGLFDLLAASMCIYAMIISTPVGELFVRGYRWATGGRPSTRALISYFDTGGGANDTSQAQIVAARPTADSSTTRVADRVGLSPAVARAVAVLAASGQVSADGHLEVVLPLAGVSSFNAAGLPLPIATMTAEQRESLFLEGVAKLATRLGSDEAAVCATAVDLAHVEYAIRRARASGVEPANQYVSFRQYLPPEFRDDADAIVDGSFALAIAFEMSFPLATEARVSSSFGERVHPVLRRRKMHAGTDFAVPVGTDIIAVAEGRVVYSAEDAVNGRFVKIDHGHGLSSAYCHASELSVARGARVQKGDVIARSGQSGRATGPHLHFQVELNGKPIDAELFLKQGLKKSTASKPQRIRRPASRTFAM